MELLKVKDLYLPNCYPSEVNKKGVLEYFIYGKGWQKTKSFKVIDGVSLPDRWSDLTWLEIAELYDKYGLEVANQYAEKKTAGIVSRQTAKGYGLIYSKIKHIITDDFNPRLFELLRCDYMLSCFGVFILDIVSLDDQLGKLDPEYSPTTAKYKGCDCSMMEYVLQKFGQMYVDVIEAANQN